MKYASETTVSPEKSRAEIETIIKKYGASKFAYGWEDDGTNAIRFKYQDRNIQIILHPPDPKSDDFTLVKTSSGWKKRTPGAATAQWEQAVRQRWRALALVVKAKVEAIESGISTFDQEFLAFTVLPNGQTVGDWLQPQIEEMVETHNMPLMLPFERLSQSGQ